MQKKNTCDCIMPGLGKFGIVLCIEKQKEPHLPVCLQKSLDNASGSLVWGREAPPSASTCAVSNLGGHSEGARGPALSAAVSSCM